MALQLREHPFNISAVRLNGAAAGESLETYLNTLTTVIGVPVVRYTQYSPASAYYGGIGANSTTLWTSGNVAAYGGQQTTIHIQGALYCNTLSQSTDYVHIVVNIVVGGTTYTQTFILEPGTAAELVPFTFDYTNFISTFSQTVLTTQNGLLATADWQLGATSGIAAAQSQNSYPGYNSGVWGDITYTVVVAVKGTATYVNLDVVNIDILNR